MSGYGFNGYDDDDEDVQNGQGDGPAGLRAAHRALEKEVAKLRTALEERDQKITELSTKSRAQALSEILRSKQVNPKLVDLIPESVEATDEAVSAFLEKYGEVFQTDAKKQEVTPPVESGGDTGQEAGGNDEVDEEALVLQQSYDAAQAALRGAQPNSPSVDISTKLEEIGATAKSFDEAAAQLAKLPGFKVSNYNS